MPICPSSPTRQECALLRRRDELDPPLRALELRPLPFVEPLARPDAERPRDPRDCEDPLERDCDDPLARDCEDPLERDCEDPFDERDCEARRPRDCDSFLTSPSSIRPRHSPVSSSSMRM
jgi:hypothetical protein